MLSGIFGVIVLILDIWAVLQVFQSNESTGTKALWTALIVLLPVLGLIIWWVAGPRERAS